MDLAIDKASPRNFSRSLDLAGFGLTCVDDLVAQQDTLTRRRSGRIVTGAGGFQAVYGRWWPYYGNLARVIWDNMFRGGKTDSCQLFYHQPWGAPGFLTLDYVQSTSATSLSTFYAATLALDEIARLKNTDAIVCHVTNNRISDRLLERWGWQRHCQHWRGRHFIKRFYGEYPLVSPFWRKRLGLDQSTRSS